MGDSDDDTLFVPEEGSPKFQDQFIVFVEKSLKVIKGLSEVVVCGSAVNAGIGNGLTVIRVAEVSEKHPPSETLRVTLNFPAFNHFTLYGPEPFPEIIIPPLKFQLKFQRWTNSINIMRNGKP